MCKRAWRVLPREGWVETKQVQVEVRKGRVGVRPLLLSRGVRCPSHLAGVTRGSQQACMCPRRRRPGVDAG